MKQGEIIALLGDNGAGKSTLIKILSGYFRQTCGDLIWEGEKILWSKKNGTKQAKSLGIQTLYQDLGLIEDMSVLRNFFIGNEIVKSCLLMNLDFDRMAQIVENEISTMGIKRKIDPYESVSLLSGGERQVLAICRAKYFKSKLLILDEPTNALSIKQTREVHESIRKAVNSGVSVIYITHSLEYLFGLVDRYIVITHGFLKADMSSGSVTKEELEKLITA